MIVRAIDGMGVGTIVVRVAEMIDGTAGATIDGTAGATIDGRAAGMTDARGAGTTDARGEDAGMTGVTAKVIAGKGVGGVMTTGVIRVIAMRFRRPKDSPRR